MRRLLPFFCVAAMTGLSACDQEPVSGPISDDEQILYDAARAAGGIPGAPTLADGDLELSRPSVQDPVFVIIGSAARDSTGVTIQILTDATIADPDGEVLCTKTQSGGFTQLRDTDGDVLLSTVGPFVFEGQPNLAGKSAVQQAGELATHLRFSFSLMVVVEGMANTGEELVTADVPVQFASSWRKLVVASLVDGYCGSDGLSE
jgi:hypothetical protein